MEVKGWGYLKTVYLVDLMVIVSNLRNNEQSEKSFLKYVKISQEENADKILNPAFFKWNKKNMAIKLSVQLITLDSNNKILVWKEQQQQNVTFTRIFNGINVQLVII